MPQEFHVSIEEEKQRYLHHRNSPQEVGYRTFLSKLHRPLLSFLPSGARGLDFGSGPNPTLSVMFSEVGFEVDTYDPFFGPPLLENKMYDFITTTEVVEHFREPRKELDRMCSLLEEKGYLGIMTQEVPQDPNKLHSWFYFRDITHVSFFSSLSMQCWCSMVGLITVYRGEGVWILQKL